ncbi:MAG TPA: Asp23/Gls24 family envelope stress response protein [Micromonosporaceae bacterium]
MSEATTVPLGGEPGAPGGTTPTEPGGTGASAPGGTGASAPGGGGVPPALPDGDGLPPAEARGSLDLAERVVEKIATQAVSEIEYATGVSRQVLGVGRRRSRTSARVSAMVDGDIATVRITMSVVWPAPVPEVTQQVRDHVAARLVELTSLRVAEVDIEVAGLPTSYGPRARRVR